MVAEGRTMGAGPEVMKERLADLIIVREDKKNEKAEDSERCATAPPPPPARTHTAIHHS
jgi:hypothetical protein